MILPRFCQRAPAGYLWLSFGYCFGIDPYTELIIQDALLRLFQGRTSIVIAHRLSTVRRADRICVIDHGRVAEVGTHEELLARQGLYQNLYEMQFRSQEDEASETSSDG